MAPPPKRPPRPARPKALDDEVDPEEARKTSDRLPAYSPDPEEDPEERVQTGARPSLEDLDASEERASSYHTGSDYPAVDDRQEPSGEVPAVSPDEDIYGEDDALYGDDEEPPEPRPPGSQTRVAALDDIEEPAEEDGGDSPDKTHAGPPVRLEVMAGPDAGKKKRFNGVRMVVGRIPDCEFPLSDQSVSRRHLELVVGDQGVLLRDLGSGNGTKVNGEKVGERVLQHGDEIAIGKTRFKFVDEAAAVKKAQEAAAAKEAAEKEAAQKAKALSEAAAAKGEAGEATAEGEAGEDAEEDKSTGDRKALPRARRAQGAGWAGLSGRQKGAVLGAAGVFAVLVLAIVVLARRPPPPPPVDPRAVQAEEKMQLARTAARGERFDEALELIESAEKLKANIDVTGLKAVVKQELEVQKAMDQVKALLEQGKLEEAQAAIAAMPEPTSAKRGQERDALKEALEAKRVEALQAAVDEALGKNDFDKAKELAARLPEARQAAALAKLEQGQAAAAQEEKAQAHQAALQREVTRKRSQAQREAFLEEVFAGVARKFHGSEFQRAVLECDRAAEEYRGEPEVRARSTELKRLIPLFQRNFEDAQKKFKAGSTESAVRALRKAKELYTQIHFPGVLGNVIDEELAQASLGAGRAAQARGDLGTAAIDYRESLRLNPNDEAAKDGLQRLAQAAEDLYLEAYMIRDRDPREAANKLRTVIEVSAPGTALRDKAEKQLQLIAPH